MKKLLNVLFRCCAYTVAVIYIFAALTHFISPDFIGAMALLALGFSYLAGAMLLLIVCWLFIDRKKALYFFIVLLVGGPNLSATFGVHFFTKSTGRPPGTVRIMTWNVRAFENPSMYLDTPGFIRRQMFDYIRDSAPDIICLQEFMEHQGKGLISNTTELIDLGYSYYYFSNDFKRQYHWGAMEGGTAIFSRFPIHNSGKKMYPDTSFPEHVIFADIAINNRMVRVFTTHFKSLNLGAVTPGAGDKAAFYGDTNFVYTASKTKKLMVFAQEHVKEATIAKNWMDESPYPVIFCGDLNSVPTSYVYRIISRNLNDAFLQRGCGFGTTMDSLPKPLRIDYLLLDKQLHAKNYFRNELHLSDHYPQMADIDWR